MAGKNRIFTEEHRRKLSESHKGQKAWNKGKKGIYSEETILKMKEANKGRGLGEKRSPEVIEKMRKSMIGKNVGPLSEEHKENIRKGTIGKSHKQGNRKSRKGIPIGFVPKCAFKKGVIPWNYVDGRSSKIKWTERYDKDWNKIRQQALMRDKFVCQKCNSDNILLEVHHILSFLLTKDNSLDNLISLCKKCHRKIEAMEMRMLKSKKIA